MKTHDHYDYDELLAAGRRTLRIRPKANLLGPTGARLWADVLDQVPGFAGAIDFIHKTNIPLLYTVEASVPIDYQLADVNWRPSHLAMTLAQANLHFTEQKFISWEDVAVSCQTWRNEGEDDLIIRLTTHPDVIQHFDTSGCLSGVVNSGHGFDIRTAIAFNEAGLREGLVIPSGQTVRLVIAAALGIEGEDSAEALKERAERIVHNQFDRIVINQQTAYNRWFDKTPQFVSDDALLNKTWAYRWFIMRHNLADPRYGHIQQPLFYEGRSHKMTKTPFAPDGWEFSKLIPLTQPMHLLEARWHHDSQYGAGIFSNMEASQGEDGRYNCLFVDGVLPHSYSNFMGWASYQYYLVHRDAEAARRMLPSLKKQIIGESKVYGNPSDSLLIEYNHKRTGKEYQPSYWYFHDYPDDCMNPDTYTPLKRVDRSVYHYLNCLGVASLCELLGDDDASRFREWAEKIRKDIMEKMWDEKEQFFFDLHPETDEKAYVKNIVGFYPFWAQMDEDSKQGALSHLFDERAFNTACPFPSVSVDCPIYTAEGGWKGTFIKGRNGCVWNGPTWPYTNSIVLDALANVSKRRQHKYDAAFGKFLREYAWLHYAGRDLQKPYLVEHYNSQTGEAISDDVDYNHSYFIDLVMRHVVGIQIEKDRLVLDPVDIGLTYFEVHNVRIAGLSISVTYSKPGASDRPTKEGYRLYINGKEAAKSSALKRMEVEI